MAFDNSNCNTPPRLPGKLQYHYNIKSSLDTIHNAINTFLRNICSDSNFDFENYFYTCLYYHNHEEICFAINIYIDKSYVDEQTIEEPSLEEPSYVVEFQHLSGDRFGYINAIHPAKHVFVQYGLIHADLSEFMIPVMLPPVMLPPVMLPPDMNVEKMILFVNSMLNMAESDFIDIQTQGLLALADVSCKEDVRQLLMNENALRRLLRCIESNNSSIHRLAMITLGNLCADQTVVSFLVKCGLLNLLQNLSCESNTIFPQVYREIGRLLVLMIGHNLIRPNNIKQFNIGNIILSLRKFENSKMLQYADIISEFIRTY